MLSRLLEGRGRKRKQFLSVSKKAFRDLRYIRRFPYTGSRCSPPLVIEEKPPFCLREALWRINIFCLQLKLQSVCPTDGLRDETRRPKKTLPKERIYSDSLRSFALEKEGRKEGKGIGSFCIPTYWRAIRISVAKGSNSTRSHQRARERESEWQKKSEEKSAKKIHFTSIPADEARRESQSRKWNEKQQRKEYQVRVSFQFTQSASSYHRQRQMEFLSWACEGENCS